MLHSQRKSKIRRMPREERRKKRDLMNGKLRERETGEKRGTNARSSGRRKANVISKAVRRYKLQREATCN